MEPTVGASSRDGNGEQAVLEATRLATPPSLTRHRRTPATILLAYPATLFLGFLYALLSPDAKLGANNTAIDQPVNYFAKKSNIVNQLFVKIGWFWTTLAFVCMLLVLPAFRASRPDSKQKLSAAAAARRRLWQACARYALVTASWVITTQWAFGPPLVDRGFTATGGKCTGSFGTADNVDDPQTALIFSQAECKLSGGTWKGGRDISGHVFMLVLMSAFLYLEWQGASSLSGLSSCGRAHQEDGEKKNQEGATGATTVSGGGSEEERPHRWMRLTVWGMVGLSFWMLLMTAIFFHTWGEKIAGLMIAISTIYAVYFLPQDMPALQRLVGVPGL
ncbi:hypothetical protein KEM52_003978 [Ascosphaera acerosa]|nr:hypothetical protein KEM52_003978 [Ascosphaera acerosa]